MCVEPPGNIHRQWAPPPLCRGKMCSGSSLWITHLQWFNWPDFQYCYCLIFTKLRAHQPVTMVDRILTCKPFKYILIFFFFFFSGGGGAGDKVDIPWLVRRIKSNKAKGHIEQHVATCFSRVLGDAKGALPASWSLSGHPGVYRGLHWTSTSTITESQSHHFKVIYCFKRKR